MKVECGPASLRLGRLAKLSASSRGCVTARDKPQAEF